jgi:hypothetical protein
MASNAAWGKGAGLVFLWSQAANEVRKDLKDDGKVGPRSVLAWAGATIGTAFILNPGWANGVRGSLARATFWFTVNATRAIALPIIGVATSAEGLALIIPVVVGAVVSDAIDEEEGFDNYTGFISGGTWPGSNDPNYLTGDPNDSGYFNVPKNLETITSSQPLTRALTWTISESDKKVESWEKILGFGGSEQVP